MKELIWILLLFISFAKPENPRWARAANSSFDDFVVQMTAASQVFAGISLETGFLDDSIPSDATLAELLNLKNADLAKLENFDNTTVPAFFSKLTVFPDNELEVNFLTVNSWVQEHKNLTNPLDLTPVDDYLDKLDSLNKKNILPVSYDDAIKCLTELIPLLEAFRQTPEVVPKKQVVQLGYQLFQLKGKLEEIDQKPDLLHIQNLKDFNNEKLEEYGHLEVFGLIKFRDQIDSSSLSSKLNSMAALFNSFQSASSLSSELTAASLIFVELLNIFESFDSHIDRTHTSGLASGFRDLKTIQVTAKNPVFSSLIDNYEWNTVEKGLSPLVPLAKNCETLHNQWRSAHQLNSTETIKSLIEVQQKLANLQNVIKLGEQYLIDVVKVKTPGAVIYTDAKNAADSLRLLKEKIDSISRTVKELVDSKSFQDLSRLSELKKLINYSGNGVVPEGELQGVLTSMRKFTGMDDMIQSLKNHVKFYNKLNIAMKGFSLGTSLQEVVNNRKTLESFVADSDIQDTFRYLNDLKKFSELGKITEAITTIQSLRKIKTIPKMIDNVSKASSSFVLSSGELKTLRSTPNSIKQSTVPEVRSMLNLKGLIDHSRVFGKAAEGLNILKIAIGKEKSFNDIMSYSGDFEDLIKHVSDVSLQVAYREDLGDMKTFQDKVKEVKDALDARRNSLNTRKRSATDFGQKFSKLAGLSDYDLNLATVIKFIEEMKAHTSPSWIEFKDSLVELDSLDLHFAKHNAPFSAMPKVLSDIFKLFGAAAKKPVLPLPSGDPSGPAASGGGQGSATTSRSWVGQSGGSSGGSGGIATTEEPQSRNGQSAGSSDATTQAPGTAWWVYLLIGVAVLLVVGFIICAICCILKGKDKKKKKKEEAKEAVKDALRPLPVNPTTPPPPPQPVVSDDKKRHRKEDNEDLLDELNDRKDELDDREEDLKDQQEVMRMREEVLREQQKRLDKKMEEVGKTKNEKGNGKDKKALLESDELKARRRIEDNRNCGVPAVEFTAEQKEKFAAVLSEEAKLEYEKADYLKKREKNTDHLELTPIPLLIILANLERNKLVIPSINLTAIYPDKTLMEIYFLDASQKIKDSLPEIPYTLMQKNLSACKNPEILCYDDNRVSLSKLGVKSRFISASYAFTPYWKGIITQLPTPKTGDEESFWAMIYAMKNSVMVFINHENNDQYNYPRKQKKKKFGMFTVVSVGGGGTGSYIKRKFKIFKGKEKRFETRVLYEFNEWKTDAIPTGSQFRSDLKALIKTALLKPGVIPVIYDIDGGFKPMTLYGTSLIYLSVHRKGVTCEPFFNLFKSMLLTRGNTITSGEQMALMNQMALELMISEGNYETPDEMTAEMATYKLIHDKEYDAKLRAKKEGAIKSKVDPKNEELLPLEETQKSVDSQ